MSDLPTGTPGERPRVALFQAFWRLHSSTVYSALMLADAGYRVDLFLFTVDDSMPMKALYGVEGVFVHSFEAANVFRSVGEGSSVRFIVAQLRRIFLTLPRRAMTKFWNYILLLMKSDRGLIPKNVLDRT